jgi:hypothetical protein
MLARICALPPSWSLRWNFTAPQQPASGRDHGLDAGRVEHARGGAVDVGHHRRLHAAREHQHLARMRARGPGAGLLLGRHLGLAALGQQAAHGLAQLHRGPNSGDGRPSFSAQRSAFAGGARHLLVDDLAADVDQVAVLHAARAGAFAVAAGQAAVQVQLRLARGRLAFEHLLDQVDAAARAVELVAQQLVGRAGGGAEAAVHALAQDGFGLAAFGGAAGIRGRAWVCISLNPANSRPRLKMPCGSNCCISARWMRSSGALSASKRHLGTSRTGRRNRVAWPPAARAISRMRAAVGQRLVPALAAMPFDQRRAPPSRQHRRGLRHRQAPQRIRALGAWRTRAAAGRAAIASRRRRARCPCARRPGARRPPPPPRPRRAGAGTARRRRRPASSSHSAAAAGRPIR